MTSFQVRIQPLPHTIFLLRQLNIGFHGVVTRSIRGCDTRALKQEIVTVVSSILGGTLTKSDYERIASGHVVDQASDLINSGELEQFLLASKVIDQFGVVRAKSVPHQCLMFVRKNYHPTAEKLLQDTIDRGDAPIAML